VHADKFCKVEISDEIPERKQHQRAAADPNAATRRSVAKATSSLARTAMAAVCVAAIWAASAASISSFGFAASIIASEAFMESSEIPPKGERHAGGWTLASLPSAPHTLTRTGGTRRWPATGVGELFGL
jgi:hypothetical protein